MKAFSKVTSRAIPMWLSDVDTDMIIPAQYLTQITKSGYGEYLFARLKEKEGFVFNQSCYKGAKILLSGANFGCGSSREHAVWALQQAGIKVIIAPSFSDIFFNNAAKNGLLLVELDSKSIESFVIQAEKDNLEITVNLENLEVIVDGKVYPFQYDPFRRECLLKGQGDLEYLLAQESCISNYENNKQKVVI
ncbi:MAG: 3-isopropylmalate dehydratase small subunit [Gammaproteobacteria bacterium]|nr:MAG: 3-isopropylmalate dehydratase small subunit [Gammaproteobacteria bacterium]UTW43828.1 3-isopropylmalate dehydratase small subunit [bacterium SCSIO 12844]